MTVVQMSEQLEQRSPTQELIAQVRGDNAREQIQQALPVGVPVERFVRATVTALRDDEADGGALVAADRNSLFQALVKCAADGLVPDKREAALVVYKGKVQYLPMIGGVRKIAAEFGWTIKTYAVHENDVFDVDLGTGHVTHRPPRLGEPRGAIRGAWANAHHRDGRESIVEVMDMDAINKAKAVARTDRVWNQWPAQMAEKTVGHRIAKKLPLDPVDRERMDRVVSAVEVGPEESAALLYGPGARASFGELPSGEAPFVDDPDFDASPVAQAPAEDAPSAQGAEADTLPTGTTAPASAPTPEPSAPDEEALMLAAEAAEYVPPSGKFADGGEQGPLTLGQILDLGDDGRKYLNMLLSRLGEGEWRTQVEAFARVQMPAEYAAARKAA